MRLDITRSALVLLLVWGCSGSTNYFEESNGSSGKGGTGQAGAAQGGTAGSGGASGGTGGATGGSGGASGGTGGATGGSGGASGGTGGATGGSGGASGGTGGATGGSGGNGVGGGAGSPVGGSGGLAGAGQGGAAGASACTDPDAVGGRGDGTTKQSTATGTNGDFSDTCDENGNLIEYACEIGQCVTAKIAPASGGIGSVVFPVGGAGGVAACPTGRVVPRTVDCGGHCSDGACFGWCAEQGGSFEVTGVAGTNLEMTNGDFSYTCSVAFQREGYDCLGDELVGRTMVVTSLGSCTGGSTTFGWDDPESASIEECAFTCALK